MKGIPKLWLACCAALAAQLTADTGQARAQILLPEYIYYTFNEGSGSTTANLASPGVGANPATVNGHTLDDPGVFGSTALNGAGGTASNVNTGWATAFGTGAWTIAFWHSPVNSNTTTLSYIYGDSSAGSLRMFNHGVAGPTGMILRGGGMNDVNITGLSTTAPNHLAYVYDPTLGNINGYLNGVLATTIAQPALNINGTGLLVGGYQGNNGLRADYWMDEFQLYSRALSAANVVDAMNANFIPVPEPGSLGLAAVGVGFLVRFGRRRSGSAVAERK